MNDTVLKHNKRLIRRICFAGAMLIVMIAAFTVRYRGFAERGFEYDELWTRFNYGGKSVYTIFTDLATPNNHPLHSLVVKGLLPLFGPTAFSLRADALLAGFLLVAIAGYIARFLFNSRLAAFYAASFCAFSGALVHYSQTSRGYIIQAFLIAVVAAGLILYKRGGRFCGPLLCCIASGAAVLTLSTSILFIVPLFGVFIFAELDWHDLKSFIRRHIPILTAFALVGAFCIFWYLSNFEQFQAGKRMFGNKPASLAAWFDAVFVIIRDCGSFLIPLSLLMLFDKKKRVLLALFVFIFIFPFACSPLTTLGPPRAYLPLIPFCCIAAAGGVLILHKRMIKGRAPGMALAAGTVLLAISCGRYELKIWTPFDWAKAFPAIESQTPKDAFIAYPASDSFVIFGNHPDAKLLNIERIPSEKREYLFINMISDDITGIRVTDSATLGIKPPFPAEVVSYPVGLRAYIYKLVPLSPSSQKSSGIILMTVSTGSHEKALVILNELKSNKNWFILNSYLTFRPRAGCGYRALFISDKPGLSHEAMLKVEAANPGEIFFYTLEPLNGK